MAGFFKDNPPATQVGSEDATESTIQEDAVTQTDTSGGFYQGSPDQTTTDAYTADALASKNAAEAAKTAAEAAQAASETAKTAAELAETNAETAETNAETAETNAETAETNAAASESAAATSATSAAGSATTATTKASEAATSASNAATSATSSETAKTAAETAETNAETAETNAASSASSASTSASNASTSATAASGSASAASTSETNAASSATAAATSATNAATSETNAASSATTATTKASEASTSATNASASETAAQTAETNAETAEANAETAETNAAASASAASTSASNASTSATAASGSASAASTSETNAAASETNAATSETNAATSETNAASSATSASGSATTATTQANTSTTQAGNSATSATAASNSASSAASAQTAAEAARDSALAALDSFDDRYLGSKSSAPTVDNDGNALVSGALYFDSTSNAMKVYDGSQWLNAYASLSGALIANQNLSDLDNAATARTNLGLGTAATTAASDYATAAQGTTADNALAASSVSTFGGTLIDDADAAAARTTLGLGTAATTASSDYATAAQADQTVALTGSGATTVSGTYPNFTITSTDTNTDTNTEYTAGSGLTLTGTVFSNSAPDQTVALTGSGGTTVSGTYPNFTISSAASIDGTTINPSSVQIGGTTVIDSSRNLSNIAQINANGSVYVNDDATGNNYLFLKKSTSGDGHLLFQDGTDLKWQNVHNTSSGNLNWYSYAASNTVFQIKSAGGIKIGATGGDSSLESQYGQIIGGFGARTTGGTTDWNHSTNARSGNGYTLLTGSATNGPGGGNYFHPISFEYGSYDGSGNMTQLAIGYNSNEMYSRYRYSNSWSAWSKFFTSEDDRLVVDRDIKSAGQVRATGWWGDAASTDYNSLALEIGQSSGTSYVLSYNRDTSSYGPMVFEANSFDFNNQVQAAKIRTDFNAAQVAPRFDTSFYVLQSQHFYGHNDSQVLYVGEPGNDVYLRGQIAVGGTGVSSGYKLDLHGHTHAHNNEINYLGQLHFNSGARLLDDSGGNYTIHRSGVNTSGGFKMQNSSGSNQGYFYWDGSGIGILSSDGGWAIQNTNGATTVHHAAAFNSTVVVSSTLTASARLNGDRIGVTGTSSSNGRGISLYGGANDGEPTYGIHFNGRATFGGHGALGASDWATYFTQNDQNGRGWIFRRVGGSNVASIDTSGNLELNGNANAYLYRGTSNVAGTGDASYHPSGIYSTGTNWLYGTMYLNGNSINMSGGSIASGTQAVFDQQYGRGVFGVYSATRYQHVWMMGTAYKTAANGTSPGNAYGLTYTHTNIGTGTNQSISGLSHQLQGRQNGTLTWAMGTGIWTAHNITAYSDISVKTNLERIPDALSKVCQLNGYTYDRTDYEADPETGITPETRQAGVVAQEVEKVLPEVVSGEEGNKAVAYGNMVSLLIEAIKEQQGQIEDLKQEIQTLKGSS